MTAERYVFVFVYGFGNRAESEFWIIYEVKSMCMKCCWWNLWNKLNGATNKWIPLKHALTNWLYSLGCCCCCCFRGVLLPECSWMKVFRCVVNRKIAGATVKARNIVADKFEPSSQCVCWRHFHWRTTHKFFGYFTPHTSYWFFFFRFSHPELRNGYIKCKKKNRLKVSKWAGCFQPKCYMLRYRHRFSEANVSSAL